MIKSTSFIVLTQFFHFNELKILRQPGYLIFEVKPTIFFLQCVLSLTLRFLWKAIKKSTIMLKMPQSTASGNKY